MAGSRMVKTLVALVVAMTVGALALILMETDPIIPAVTRAVLIEAPNDFHAVAIDADAPLNDWRNIIVHSAVDKNSTVARGSHFIIMPDGTARDSGLWRRQETGTHVSRPRQGWNNDSVGICLIGDFSRITPTASQYKMLVSLTRKLQKAFHIAPDNVYLAGQIGQIRTSPQRAFPSQRWEEALLAARAVR